MTGPRPCQTRGREGQNTSITLWGVALGHVPGPAPARHRANRRGPRAGPPRASAPPGAALGRPRPRCAAGPRVRACRIGIMCGIWRDLLHAADDFRIVSGYRRYRRVRVRSPRRVRQRERHSPVSLGVPRVHPVRLWHVRSRHACQAQGRGIDTTRVLRSARWTFCIYFIVYSLLSSNPLRRPLGPNGALF
jgi:hypothetical protein